MAVWIQCGRKKQDGVRQVHMSDIVTRESFLKYQDVYWNMLSQILYDKPQDVGKKLQVF